MPFLFLGIVLLIISVYLLRKAVKSEDKEGIIGLTALILASAILILFYGFFYTVSVL